MQRHGSPASEHAPGNVMRDPDEIAQFYDLCSDLMRELLDALARDPDDRRPLGAIEDALAWPTRRIASMLGGVARLRIGAFDGRRPYHLGDETETVSGRWEIWVDGVQSGAIRDAKEGWTHGERRGHSAATRSQLGVSARCSS
jgi:hypothetical protein